MVGLQSIAAGHGCLFFVPSDLCCRRRSRNSSARRISETSGCALASSLPLAFPSSKSKLRTPPSLCRCSAVAQAASSSSSDASFSVKWGQWAAQGPRAEMEDAAVIKQEDDGLNGYTFVAIFDGHSGSAAVKFLKTELYRECAGALQHGTLLDSNDVGAIETAIQEAFLRTDSRLLSWLEETTQNELESGATATVLFLRGDSLIVAHVGDSRVVISRGGKAEVISGDHRPFGKSKVALSEIKRVREAGGWINNGRVCGILSISRAFGDIQLKTRRQEMLMEGVQAGRWTTKFASRIELNGDWITAIPDLYRASLGNPEFVILASDGLWDAVNSSDAVRIVRNQLCEHGDVQLAAEALTNAALERNTQDNVSVIIADFGRVQMQSAPIEEQHLGMEVGQALITVGVVSFGVWLSQFARNWAF